MRSRSRDVLVAGATVLYALAALALAYLQNIGLLAVAMLATGVAWISILSALQVSAQMTLPAWVRARGLAAFVRVRTQTPEYESAVFERFIQEEEQILECHDVDGEDCYLLKVRTASTQSLQKLLMTIRSFPGITRTVTTIALETLKEGGTVRPAINRTKPEEG